MMSKPYQYTWDDSQSPLDRRPPNTLTPTSAGGHPVTYATNVNRQKTKRWVEAKTFSYDGDDWGDVDDYDEYGQGYDQSPPPPQQPAGLRQPGQGAGSTSGAAQAPPQSVQGQGRKPYGNLQDQPPLASYAQPDRSATNPALPTINTVFGKARSNSFDEGDEARAFSAGGAQPTGYRQPSRQTPPITTEPDESNAPATRFSQMGVGSSSAAAAGPGVTSPGGGSPSPYQDRRDFSPSAMPEPLQARASPAPASVPDTSHGGRFPPRKSSMNQHSSPYVAPSPQAAVELAVVEGARSGSRSRSSSMSNGADARAGGAGGKPLPFVRPADIYRRMEEEREKERKSLDSSRPSLDSTSNPKADDSELTSPTQAGGLKEKLSSESLGRGVRARQSLEDGQDSSRRVKPSLDPVRERKSEYGFENLLANAQTTGEVAPTHKEVDRAVSDTAVPLSQAALRTQGTPTSKDQYSAEPTTSRFESGPKLPDLHRISGFGDYFFVSPSDTQAPDVPTAPQSSRDTNKLEVAMSSPDETSKVELQHSPSVGFRSVVHQAFDRTYDKSIPPTPVLSAAGSNDDSGVKRTDSTSTSGISPIMSRVSSTSTAAARAKGAEAREMATPAIAEEENLESRRNSKASMTPGAEGHTIVRKPSPSQRQESGDSLPQSFKLGHRRDMSIPNSLASPKRSPVVELNRQLPAGEDVEVTTELVGLGLEKQPERSLDNAGVGVGEAIKEAADTSPVDSVRDKETAAAPTTVATGPDSATSSQRGTKSVIPPLPLKEGDSRSGSPVSRSESPNKGRVRDLAGKFENSQQKATERRGSSTSSTGRRQLAEEGPLESFRPVLPGSWASYSTTAGASAPDVRGHQVTAEPADMYQYPPAADRRSEVSPDTPRLAYLDDDDDFDIIPTTKKRQLSEVKQKGSSKGPIAAVAVAGAAAAGAFATAVGLQKREKSPLLDAPSSAVSLKASKESELAASSRSVLPLEPPVSQKEDRSQLYNMLSGTEPIKPPPLQKTDSSNSESSMPPPPPPKDTPPNEDIAPPVPLKQKVIDSVATRDITSPEQSTSRPSILPSLSTDTAPNDEESDKLRKQIVKTLSQRHSAEQDPEASATLRPGADRHLSTDSRALGQRPESSYLPSEYDSYFNGTEEDEYEIPHIPIPQPEPSKPVKNERTEIEHQLAPIHSPITESSDRAVQPVYESVPTSPPATEQPTREVLGSKPNLMRNRFSWEKDDTDEEDEMTPVVPNAPQHGKFYPDSGAALAQQVEQNPWQDRPVSSITTPDLELRELASARNAYLGEAGSQTGTQSHPSHAHPLPPLPSGASPTSPSSDQGSRSMAGLLPAQHEVESPIKSGSQDETLRVKGDEVANVRPIERGLEVSHHNDGDHSNEALAAAGGAAAAAAVTAGLVAQHGQGDRSVTPTETVPESQVTHLLATQSLSSKESAMVFEQQITPTPNIEEHPFHSPIRTSSEAPPHPESTPRQEAQGSQEPEAAVPLPPPYSTAQQKHPPTFREILNLKTPAERIKAYNEAREQYANMNSGLSNWVAHTSSQDPENADLVSKGGLARISTGGFAHKSTPSKMFFHKHSPSAERPSPALQEPYYKQYMQFQSNPITPSSSAAASQTPVGTPSGVQGFGSPPGSGAHTKLTTQQVQAKGKDLLHTAGVLGGKAGGAASKLFAKGRNKLKGDKASASTSTPSLRQTSPGSTSSRALSFKPERDPSPTPTGARAKHFSFQGTPPLAPQVVGGKGVRPASVQVLSSASQSFVPPGTPSQPVAASAVLTREGYGSESPGFGGVGGNKKTGFESFGGGYIPKPWAEPSPATPPPVVAGREAPREGQREEQPVLPRSGDGNLPGEVGLGQTYTSSPLPADTPAPPPPMGQERERDIPVAEGQDVAPARGDGRGRGGRNYPEDVRQALLPDSYLRNEDPEKGHELHIVNPDELTPTPPPMVRSSQGDSPIRVSDGGVGGTPPAASRVYYPPPQLHPQHQERQREFTPLSHDSLPSRHSAARTVSRDVSPAPAPAPEASATSAMYQRSYPPQPVRESSRDDSLAPASSSSLHESQRGDASAPQAPPVVYERPQHYYQREVAAPRPAETSSRDVSPIPPAPTVCERLRGGALAPAFAGASSRDVSPAAPSYYEGQHEDGLALPRAAGVSREVSPLRTDDLSTYSQQQEEQQETRDERYQDVEPKAEDEVEEVGSEPTKAEFTSLPPVRRTSTLNMEKMLGDHGAGAAEEPGDVAENRDVVDEDETVPPPPSTQVAAVDPGVLSQHAGEETRDDDDVSSIQPEPEHLEHSPARQEISNAQDMPHGEGEPHAAVAPQPQRLGSDEVSSPSGGLAPLDALAAREDISRQATPESFFASKPHPEQVHQELVQPNAPMTSLRRQSSPSTGRRGPPRSLTLQRAIEQHQRATVPEVPAPVEDTLERLPSNTSPSGPPPHSPTHHDLYNPPSPPAQRPAGHGQQLYDVPGRGTPPQHPMDERQFSTPSQSQFGPPPGHGQEQVYRPPVLVTRPGQPPQFATTEQPPSDRPRGYPPSSGRPMMYQQSTGPGEPPQDYRPPIALQDYRPPITPQDYRPPIGQQDYRPPILYRGSPAPMGPPGPQSLQQQGRPMGALSPGHDLPHQYYPRQLPQSESMFARQQGTEYQLKGVGPPEPSTQPKAKRASGFLKGLGSITGKSDKSQHARTLSKAQPPAVQNLTPLAEYERRNSMISATSSTDQQEKQKRRSGFFGLAKTGSGEGLQKQQLEQQQQAQPKYQPPQPQYQSQQQLPPSRDRASWINISSALKNGQDRPSPSTPTGATQSPVSGRRSSLLSFSKESSGKESKPNKLTRSGTAGATLESLSGKKKGLSGLTNIFGRSGTTGHSPRPPASNASSRGQQQSPPRYNYGPGGPQQHYIPPPTQPGVGARPDFIGQRPPLGGYYAPQNAMYDSPPPRAMTYLDPPPAPQSLDPGFVGGRRLSEQQIGEKKHTFESSTGFRGPYRGGSTPPGSGGHPPAGYGSLPRSSSVAAALPPRADLRPTIPLIEPQYETPPIPAPYGTVVSPRGYEQLAYQPPQLQSRGQHGHPADYNSRTPQSPYTQTPPPPSDSLFTPYNLAAPAPLPTLMTQGRNPNGTRMGSISEDVAARSPPKEHPGQQRPWTLSLPGESAEENYARSQAHPQPPSPHDDVVYQNPPQRNSYSPANYPLPESRITSPISERSAHSFSDPRLPPSAPPIPPPKVPQHSHREGGEDPRRSNTQDSEILATSATSAQQSPTSPSNPPPTLQSSAGASPTKPQPPALAPVKAVGVGLSSSSSTPVASEPASPTHTAKRALGRTPSSAAELETTEPDGHLTRRRAQEEKLIGVPEQGGGMVEEEDEDEVVVMSSTAYPGQEWAPEGYGRWEGD